MLKIKVCGLKYPENISQIVQLLPDYIGFIFYQKSPRFCDIHPENAILNQIPKSIKKTGVFVNESLRNIESRTREFSLDVIQLHGNEPVEFCKTIKNLGKSVIKAFQIDDDFNFKDITPYHACCDFYLFDTKTSKPGGSGKLFNWKKLKEYDNHKEFILSGGIGIDNLDALLNLKNLNIHAIDINSRFEHSPGLKNVEKVSEFMLKIRINNAFMKQLNTITDKQNKR